MSLDLTSEDKYYYWLMTSILNMHNQQGFESDNDSCSIDKKDKHPPSRECGLLFSSCS